MNLPVIVLAALVASIAGGGLVTGGVALLLRVRKFDATTRHALWFSALVLVALLPVAGIGVSVARAVRVPVATPHSIAQPSGAARQTGAAPAQSFYKTQSRTTASSSAATSSQTATSSSPKSGTPAETAAQPSFWSLSSLSSAASLTVLATLLVVALVGLVWLAVSVVRIGAVKRRSSPLDDNLAHDLPWLTETHRGRETYLRLSYEIEAPVAIGFNRPVILIPTELATHNGLAAIEDLVIHEHAHLCRYDDYTNLAQRVIERLFWFNPFVWVIGRRIALEREMAADDAVVARTADRTRYADALWRLAREMRMPAYTLVAPGALFTRKQISIRIEALVAPGRAQLKRLGPASAAGAVVVGLLACAVVAVAAPPLELPAPPAPPAAPTISQKAAPPAPHVVVHEVVSLPAPKPAVHPQPNAATEATLAHLSGIIATRLADINAEMANRKTLTAERIAEQRHEVAMMRDKLATMQHMAHQDNLPVVSGQIADLENDAQALDEHLGAPPAPPTTVNVPSINLKAPGVNVEVPPIHVSVPATKMKSPAVTVPPVDVNVPPVNVNVPGVSVHVPGVQVHVPATHVEAPRSAVIASLSGDQARNTSLTRDLIAHCSGCDLSHRDLRNLDLHGLSLVGFDLTGADLRGANLSGAQLSGTDLSNANLDGANLTNAQLTGADISGASFRGAKMDGVRLSGISLQHSRFDDANVRAILVHGCSGCDLSHMDLRGIDLHGLRLEGSDFSHSDLTGANLSGTHFSGVSFDGANLNHADLRDAVLTGCSLNRASLDGARLEGIKLSGTSLDP